MYLSYLGPVSCVITSWVSSGLTLGSGCSLMAVRWQVFFVSFLSSLRAHQLTSSPLVVAAWLQSLMTMTSFVYWYGKQIFHLSTTIHLTSFFIKSSRKICNGNLEFSKEIKWEILRFWKKIFKEGIFSEIFDYCILFNHWFISLLLRTFDAETQLLCTLVPNWILETRVFGEVEFYYFSRQRGTQWAPVSKMYVSQLGEDSEKFYSNCSKRAWSACGHSSDWLVVKLVGISIINLQFPTGLGSTCLWAAYHC